MKLIHYSRKSNLKSINPEMQGTGAPAEENKQGVPSVTRSYWYLEGTTPENVVTSGASHVYRATLHPGQRIYDVYKDPDSIYQELKNSGQTTNPGLVTSDEYLQAIKDRGYHGFTNSGHGTMSNVVAIFHPQEIEAEEQIRPEHHEKASLLKKSEDHTLGHHFLFTVENPMYPKQTSGTPEEVVDRLKNLGEDAQMVEGHYGAPENSIMVRSPKNIELLHKIAKAHGQESAIESDGFNHKLFFYNGPNAGKYLEGSGTQWFTEPPEDFYTGIRDKHGNSLYFRHHIDGEELKEGKHVPTVREMHFDDPWDQAKHDRGGDEELARYNDRGFSKVKKSEDSLEDLRKDFSPAGQEFANFQQSLNGDVIDESQVGPYYKPKKVLADYNPDEEEHRIDNPDLPMKNDELEPNTTITPQATLEDLYRSYKNSPHHPRALALKYMIHRIENAHAYNGADPGTRDVLDSDFLTHHQKGDAGKKNGLIGKTALRKFVAEAQGLAAELIQHKNKLHQFLQTYSGQHIKNVNGVPSVALTRGLSTATPGPDHALASYSDTKHPVLGEHAHRRWVPLSKVWYSYDVGPKEASSDDHGDEQEFLVSSHNPVPAQESDVMQLVPRGRNHMNMTPLDHSALKLIRRDRMSPDEIRNLHASFDQVPWNNRSSLKRAIVNHPDVPADVVEKYVNALDNGWSRLDHYHGYGKEPVNQLPGPLLHKVVEKALKYSPGDVGYLIMTQPNMSPATKKLIWENRFKVQRDALHPAQKPLHDFLTQYEDEQLAASEKDVLEKRSKNVRQKTRNLSSDDRTKRFIGWLGRQGIKARASRQDRFGVGPKQNELLFTPERGSPEHEYAHQLMTPDSMTPREYQKQLGQVTASSTMTPEQRQSDEKTAFMMQPKLARLAGVSAQDTKNVGMLSDVERERHAAAARAIVDSKIFKSEGLEYPINYLMDNHGEPAVDHLLSFVHPHDLHAIRATMVDNGYPVDDKSELLRHISEVVNTQEGRQRMAHALNRLPEIHEAAYSSGAKQAKAFDQYLKHAHKAKVDRLTQSWAKMQQEGHRMADMLSEDVEKKLHSEHQESIEHAHDSARPGGSEHDTGFSTRSFNASKHVQDRRGHDQFQTAIDSDVPLQPKKGFDEGWSPKSVNKIGGTTYMAKPYHLNHVANEFNHVLHNSPGWSTLTTKDLFDAAGIGHLAEDVRGGTSEGIPVTLHKFSRGFRTISHLDNTHGVHPEEINQGDLAKIAVMDFLTNNTDRHGSNMMVSNSVGPDGLRKLKAIDHEMNFGYLGDASRLGASNEEYDDSLRNYVDQASGLYRGAETSQKNNDYFPSVTPELKQWWRNHRDNVRKSFLESLKYVSNKNLKEHMRSNFMQRVYHMDKLVRNTADDDSLFSKKHKGITVVKPDWWMDLDLG